jgi:hypothetical protein
MDVSECVLIMELHHLFDIIWMSNVDIIIPLKIIQLCILLTSLLNALQLRIVLNPIGKISWVELLQWRRTMKLHIIPWIYLLLTEWLSINQYIPLMDLNSSTQKIYERYLGSVVVVISMNHVLSLNNNGSIILSSFTLLLYVSMKFYGILDSII